MSSSIQFCWPKLFNRWANIPNYASEVKDESRYENILKHHWPKDPRTKHEGGLEQSIRKTTFGIEFRREGEAMNRTFDFLLQVLNFW